MSVALDQRLARAAPRLVLPVQAGAAPVVLDDDQAAAVESACRAPATLVVGAPGTGKTTVALEAALAALDAGMPSQEILVLAATRRSAAALRDRFATRAARTVGAPMVRTAASAAFAILRERAEALGEAAPTLISGPEQDLILAELLAGHAVGEGVALDLPPGLPADALGLRGLRQELRDLLMRAAERGLLPADLAELGRRHDRPEWAMAAQLYDEYLAVTCLRATTPDVGARFDAAVVVDEATAALAAWESEVEIRRPRWGLVVVDDYQEATVAAARLVGALHDDGARVLLLADPDSAVQGFRGATPALVGRAAAPRGPDAVGEFGADVHVLHTSWRHATGLRGVTRRLTDRIGVVGGAAHRAALAHRGDEATSVRVAVLPSAAHEAAFVARELRAAHLLDGISWDRMAVITRTGTQLAALRRALITASVPVSVLGSDVPMRDEPAVTPLLAAVRCVTGGTLDPPTVAALLASPLGGLDAVGLRRLRRALREEELSGGGSRVSDELLVDLFADQSRIASLPPIVRRGAASVARVLAAGRAAATDGATPQGVLWAVWEASELAERWRAVALDGGPAGARADRDLDAVMALFRMAETFAERMPGASAAAFVEYLAAQELAADSLASRASGVRSVAALTPAGAAGGEWDVVVVAGVQDGVWPDLRLRDSLLGSQALVELLAGRADDAHGVGPEARRAVLADELRSFAVATSRARHRLLVTAVENTEDVPSPFCDLVSSEQAAGEAATEASPAGAAFAPERLRPLPTPPLDLRGVVANARTLLLGEVTDSADGSVGAAGHRAAGLLAALAEVGVSEAHPDAWYGVHGVSGSEPLRGPAETVEVSPSRVESVTECALRWALESAGGVAPDATSQSLGTLIHAIAQEYPRGTRADLLAALDRRWPELHVADGWPSLQLRRRAEAMIDRLADYLSRTEPALVEAPFSVDVGRAVLRGIVDRVEVAGDDVVRVADLKTGRTAATAKEAANNPQLGSYQLAVTEGALDLPAGTGTAGAALVYLARGSAGATIRHQKALAPEPDGSSWARDLVESAAEAMAGAEFTARRHTLCAMCPVRRSCPVQPEGRGVVE